MIELLGFAGSGLIITSLMMRSIRHLRIVGIIGALTFVAYGSLLQAWPVVTTNCITLLINAVHLHRLARDADGASDGGDVAVAGDVAAAPTSNIRPVPAKSS